MTYSEFRKKYPKLYQFLAAFIIQSYEEISDDKLIETYFNPEYFEKEAKVTVNESKEVLELIPFPRDIIHKNADIWFETEDEAKTWLKNIMIKLEKKIQEVETLTP